MEKFIAIIIILALIFTINAYIGKWCCHNTELLVSHYMEKTIVLPRWPFILGACFTHVIGLPYGIVSEIWVRTVDAK